MPITFEEVTADIEREPQRPQEREQRPAPAPQDLAERVEQVLRLQHERELRLCDC